MGHEYVSGVRDFASEPKKRVKTTNLSLAAKRRRKLPISMVTAYTTPSALHVDRAEIDILLVGDSLAMVELGMETTQGVGMDEMIHHCKAVSRGAKYCMMVGDMPFGSYEVNDDEALKNAYRFVKEGGMDAVKLEGCRPNTVKKIVDGGVAVMGHVGLTPQAISVIGGFRAQGRTAVKARQLVDEALALQDAGCFAIVLECVPEPVARAVTNALTIPTIGIGAGNGTTGQVLVYHDMLGMTSHPHHKQFVPKFCKMYADIGETIRKGLEEFKREVEAGEFPSEEFSPYKMGKEELEVFNKMMEKDKEERERKRGKTEKDLIDKDEYEVLKLYGDK